MVLALLYEVLVDLVIVFALLLIFPTYSSDQSIRELSPFSYQSLGTLIHTPISRDILQQHLKNKNVIVY